ncbi:unnamed protein product [Cylicocyclus nassatus]|uniref:Uncharacterized protein n=1 Tax=Cylicocyclus nassatus TaxID=53992 RepID=A0AA36M9D2_CYLNA|nr:unnamed protein product [Cylicocyclus nassatus]
MSLLTFNHLKPSDLKESEEASDSAIDEEAILCNIPRELYKPPALVAKICEEKALLKDWHKQVVAAPASFDDFLMNPTLNRFPNVLCLDRTRVRLSEEYGKGDYYHASYVDSYERQRGYILSQAPYSSTTEELFWRMVIDVKPTFIVVLGSLQGGSGPAIKRFWPETEKTYPNSVTIIQACVEGQCSDIVGIQICARKKEILRLPIVIYKEWKDDLVVPNLIEFRESVQAMEKLLPRKDGPILLVCASGVTRCGTYAALDIILTRIAKEKKVGIQQTTEIVLAQRYGCFQFMEHYKAIYDLAKRTLLAASYNFWGDGSNRAC